MTGEQLEQGYWRAYRQFYTWRNIARGAAAHGSLMPGLRHFAYASGWKKFEPLWDLVIRAKQAGAMLPVLEGILSEFGKRPADPDATARRGGLSGPPAGAPDLSAVALAKVEGAPLRTQRVIPLTEATGART